MYSDIPNLHDNQGAVDAAIDAGINFFDVSPYYGLTLAEERLGQNAGGESTEGGAGHAKCGRYGVEEFDFSAKRIKHEVENSLRRLRTDYVDLLQAHDIEFASFDQIIHEAIPAMRELQAEGKARYIGITGYPVGLLKRAAEQVEVDSILSYCRYNLMNTDMDAELVPFAEDREIGLINASPLMMGVLTDNGAPAWHPGSERLEGCGTTGGGGCCAAWSKYLCTGAAVCDRASYGGKHARWNGHSRSGQRKPALH